MGDPHLGNVLATPCSIRVRTRRERRIADIFSIFLLDAIAIGFVSISIGVSVSVTLVSVAIGTSITISLVGITVTVTIAVTIESIWSCISISRSITLSYCSYIER